MNRRYRLLNAGGEFYSSSRKGHLAGNQRTKIHGSLDCPSALRAIGRGHVYQVSRVFFADEGTATAAGFRPCGVCMRDVYKSWRARG